MNCALTRAACRSASDTVISEGSVTITLDEGSYCLGFLAQNGYTEMVDRVCIGAGLN